MGQGRGSPKRTRRQLSWESSHSIRLGILSGWQGGRRTVPSVAPCNLPFVISPLPLTQSLPPPYLTCLLASGFFFSSPEEEQLVADNYFAAYNVRQTKCVYNVSIIQSGRGGVVAALAAAARLPHSPTVSSGSQPVVMFPCPVFV